MVVTLHWRDGNGSERDIDVCEQLYCLAGTESRNGLNARFRAAQNDAEEWWPFDDAKEWSKDHDANDYITTPSGRSHRTQRTVAVTLPS